MTVRQLYSDIRQQLCAAGFTAAVEGAVLFELATGHRYTDLWPDCETDAQWPEHAKILLDKRLAGYPLQYMAGQWQFLDFELVIGEGVLIPRPETEQVAETAIALLAGQATPAVLDLCSGSGCIAIAIARAVPPAVVTAVEISEEALQYLRQNTAALAPFVQAVHADVFGYETALSDNHFAMIVANPPYVTPADYNENREELRYEPKQALLGGEDGLAFYRYLIAQYHDKLAPRGVMLFETGFDQTEQVAALFRANAYTDIEIRTDVFGLPRMVFARRGAFPA